MKDISIIWGTFYFTKVSFVKRKDCMDVWSSSWNHRYQKTTFIFLGVWCLYHIYCILLQFTDVMFYWNQRRMLTKCYFSLNYFLTNVEKNPLNPINSYNSNYKNVWIRIVFKWILFLLQYIWMYVTCSLLSFSQMQTSCALLCISLCVLTAHLSRIHAMTLKVHLLLSLLKLNKMFVFSSSLYGSLW